MVLWKFNWLAWYLLLSSIKNIAASHINQDVNLFCFVLGEATAVNEVFYSRFKFKSSFLFRFFLHGVPLPVGITFAVSGATLTKVIGSRICRFHLMYLSKERLSQSSSLIGNFLKKTNARYMIGSFWFMICW